jgi:hypothetical protein
MVTLRERSIGRMRRKLDYSLGSWVKVKTNVGIPSVLQRTLAYERFVSSF